MADDLDLRDRIADALRTAAVNLNYAPEGLADAAMAVVQPELDRLKQADDDWAASIAEAAGRDLAAKDTEIERLTTRVEITEALRAEQELTIEKRRLLAISRMVFDRIAEGEPLSRDDAADLAQRIVDEIGHSVTDEPALGPSFRVEIKRLGEQNTLLIAMLERIPEVHMRFHVVDGELADVCADWCYACKLGRAEAEWAQLKAAVARVRALHAPHKLGHCIGCGMAEAYPCATTAVLDGAEHERLTLLRRVGALDQGHDDLPAVRAFAAKIDPRKEVDRG